VKGLPVKDTTQIKGQSLGGWHKDDFSVCTTEIGSLKQSKTKEPNESTSHEHSAYSSKADPLACHHYRVDGIAGHIKKKSRMFSPARRVLLDSALSLP